MSNVLYVCIDEMSARVFDDPLLAPLMPNIQALRTSGIYLTRCYASAPVCAPTRASWLTGLWPPEHGQLGNQWVLDSRYPMLTDQLREQGFATACFGKLHTNGDESQGSGYGFDYLLNEHSGAAWTAAKQRWNCPTRPASQYDPTEEAAWDAIETTTTIKFKGRMHPCEGRHADYVLAHEAMDWISAQPVVPWFCYVSLRMPHYQLDIPNDAAYGGTDFYHRVQPGDVDLGTLLPPAPGSPAWAQQEAVKHYSQLTDYQVQLYRARYLSACAWVDRLVGDLVAHLATTGHDQDTVLVFATDHGDAASERRLFLKNTPFEESWRTPVVIRVPGYATRMGDYDGLVSVVDLLPTVAHLAGACVTSPRGLDLSVQILTDAPWLGRSEVYACDFGSYSGGVVSMALQSVAFGQPGAEAKVTRYTASPFPVGVVEGYDLVADPNEMAILDGTTPIGIEGAALLAAWQASWVPPLYPPVLG